MFSDPGDFAFPLGLSLEVYDPCIDSIFSTAPVLSPVSAKYYTNEGNLDVLTTYALDSVTAAAMNKYNCGPYTIQAVLNSASSTITNGAVDPALTKIVSSDSSKFTFSSN